MSSLSGSLRTLMRAAPGARPAELDAFLSECDAVAYAPAATGEAPAATGKAPAAKGKESISQEMIDRALALTRAIEEGAA